MAWFDAIERKWQARKRSPKAVKPRAVPTQVVIVSGAYDPVVRAEEPEEDFGTFKFPLQRRFFPRELMYDLASFQPMPRITDVFPWADLLPTARRPNTLVLDALNPYKVTEAPPVPQEAPLSLEAAMADARRVGHPKWKKGEVRTISFHPSAPYTADVSSALGGKAGDPNE